MSFQLTAAETAARGLRLQIGIWTHAYPWTDNPHADHHIEGLTSATHADCCRDALALLLKRCLQITGISQREHGESGKLRLLADAVRGHRQLRSYGRDRLCTPRASTKR